MPEAGEGSGLSETVRRGTRVPQEDVSGRGPAIRARRRHDQAWNEPWLQTS